MSEPRTRVFGVIFDLDGVLIDSGECHFESWVKLGREYGFELTREWFAHTFGMNNRTILRELFQDPSLPDEVIDELSARKEQYYRELARTRLKTIPGAEQFVRSLKRHRVPIALYTSTPRANVDFLQDIVPFLKLFHVIMTGDDVREGKPHPEGFLKALERLQTTAETTVVFEDAPAGIEAGHRAGLRVIALETTHGRDVLKDADLIIASFEHISVKDLLRWIDNWSRNAEVPIHPDISGYELKT